MTPDETPTLNPDVPPPGVPHDHTLLKYAVHPGRFVRTLQGGRVPGRNEPCPCKSGRKYKRCCCGPG